MNQICPAAPHDLPGVVDLITRLNAQPRTQSLHCAASTLGTVQRALVNKEDFPLGWERSFMVAKDSDDEVIGTLGAQLDSDQVVAWLWGPWISGDKLWSSLGPMLLAQMRRSLPATVRQLDAFLHVENGSAARLLNAHGFLTSPATHIYTVLRPACFLPEEAACYPLLRSAHEVAFSNLHADTFPARGSTPSRILLDGRDGEHTIFAATDGLRFLGSVCVSVNHAPLEGFVDYLAVKPAARGRGVGSRLLQTALRWTFETHRLPQASLCVSNWRDGARRLYEQAGFTLQATGVALRCNV